jgi:hypothetical protein
MEYVSTITPVESAHLAEKDNPQLAALGPTKSNVRIGRD